MLTHKGYAQHLATKETEKWTIGPLCEVKESNLGDCNIMLTPTTDEMCFTDNEDATDMVAGQNEDMREKWLHCLECGACLTRYSMVQMNEKTRPIDMRVIIMEFVKAVGCTSQFTRIGEAVELSEDGNFLHNKKKSIECFMRTAFGLLHHKQRCAKQGYSFAIDFNEIDENTDIGAISMAELIGIQAITMGGAGPCRVSKTDRVKGSTNVRTFRYNTGVITPKGKDIDKLYMQNKDFFNEKIQKYSLWSNYIR